MVLGSNFGSWLSVLRKILQRKLALNPRTDEVNKQILSIGQTTATRRKVTFTWNVISFNKGNITSEIVKMLKPTL